MDDNSHDGSNSSHFPHLRIARVLIQHNLYIYMYMNISVLAIIIVITERTIFFGGAHMPRSLFQILHKDV